MSHPRIIHPQNIDRGFESPCHWLFLRLLSHNPNYPLQPDISIQSQAILCRMHQT